MKKTDIVKGRDYVATFNGKRRIVTVVNITPKGRLSTYKVKTKDGKLHTFLSHARFNGFAKSKPTPPPAQPVKSLYDLVPPEPAPAPVKDRKQELIQLAKRGLLTKRDAIELERLKGKPDEVGTIAHPLPLLCPNCGASRPWQLTKDKIYYTCRTCHVNYGIASSRKAIHEQPATTFASYAKKQTQVTTYQPTLPHAPHMIVVARAGTGKTTTMIEGLKLMQGEEASINPSEQQAAIWAGMSLSVASRSKCMLAFGRDVANELKERMPPGVDAMTTHGMGFRAINKVYRGINVDRDNVQNILAEEVMETNIFHLKKTQPTLVGAVERLVELCKMNLVDPMDRPQLMQLVLHHEIDLGVDNRSQYYEDELEEAVVRMAPIISAVMDRCKDPKERWCIDHNDMIWLPIVLNLRMWRYDLLLVDEAQDLNRCQHEMVKRCGNRIILCGDPCQAIYGFRGADSESMETMQRELGNCVVFPLTVTRRCGKAIVREAQRIVPEFQAHETNDEGKVRTASITNYHKDVAEHDMIICRVNAPLVKQCFTFLKEERKAHIIGREFGQGLVGMIKRMEVEIVGELVEAVNAWLHGELAKERSKASPSEARLITLQDKADCLLCFCEDLPPGALVDRVIKKIDKVFVDKATEGIRLSSIHKVKGMEAPRVFFLMPKGAQCPHPGAREEWQRKQELNLLYVGITRAIYELVYVS